ncbi:MAG: ribose 5-phosphate isomerase B [Clostridia bacterium]|nr:ribose 5-phosphate isomerase B [Clostridia bacterium]
MKIAIGCDHGGIVLKPAIVEYLNSKGVAVMDLGCYDTQSVNYPVYALKVAKAVANGEADKGILLCGTGIGMSIAANKVHGIRAAVVSDVFCAKMCSAHNNANVLCLGGRVVDEQKAVELVDAWFTTPFEGGRHSERVDMMMKIESDE